MSNIGNAPGAVIRGMWDRLSPMPAGKQIFSAMFGRMVPYSGSVSPLVLELAPGRARVAMRDRKAVRNHLNSVHAIALMNLAEMATGLAFAYAMPEGTRSIITSLSIDYLKKARGLLISECDFQLPDFREKGEHLVEVLIRDQEGDVVARAEAKWLVGPKS
jgi:acyl-coenzyme A thioesterase PaaI-like protein